MESETIIRTLKKYLPSDDVSLVVAALRQDPLVWSSLLTPGFIERLCERNKSEDFDLFHAWSPAHLALIVLNQPYEVAQPFESIDPNLIRQLTNEYTTLIQASDTLDLGRAGAVAIALAEKRRQAGSWNTVVEAIDTHPEYPWSTPIACLLGMTTDHLDLLRVLISFRPSKYHSKLVIHAILTHPAPVSAQLQIILELTNGSLSAFSQRPLDHLDFIHILNDQNNQLAIAYCQQAIAQRSNDSHLPTSNPFHLADVFKETEFALRDLELSRLAGDTNLQSILLNKLLSMRHILAASLLVQISTLKADDPSDALTSAHLAASWKQAIDLLQSVQPASAMDSFKAGLALTFIQSGKPAQALSLLAGEEAGASDNPFWLLQLLEAASQSGDKNLAKQTGIQLANVIVRSNATIGYVALPEAVSPSRLAEVLTSHGLQTEAEQVLEHALLQAPQQITVIHKLADLQESLGHFIQAVSTLQILAAMQPQDIQLRRRLAHAYEATQNWQAALDEWNSILTDSVYPDQSTELDDLHSTANCALHAGQPVPAIHASQRALTLAPVDGLAYSYLGQAYIQQHDTIRGLDYLSKATQVSPYQPDCWLALADQLTQQNQIHQAIESLQAANQIIPNHPHLLFTLGRLQMRAGNPSQAVNLLQQAVSQKPGEDSYRFTLSQGLNQLGRASDALHELEIIFQTNPTNMEYAHAYGATLLDMGRVSDAILPLENAIQTKSFSTSKPYLDYARAALELIQQGDSAISTDAILGSVEVAITIDPDLPEVKAIYAEALQANGNYETAIKVYQEALDTNLVNDNHWKARLSIGMGQVAYELGQFDIAIASAQEAISAAPLNAESYKLLSNAYLASNLFEDALRSARTVLNLNIDDLVNLAWYADQIVRLISHNDAQASPSYQNQTKQAVLEAQNALIQGVQLAPQRADLLIKLSKLQQMTGEISAALASINLVANNDNATIEHLVQAADQFQSLGDLSGAISCLEKATAVAGAQNDKPFPHLLTRLAQAYATHGDLSAACNTYAKAISQSPELGILYYERTNLLIKLGRIDEAFGCVETGISLSLRESILPRLYFQAGWLYQQNGDISSALGYVHKGLEMLQSIPGASNNPNLSLHLADRLQIAELYKMALQPHIAYRILRIDPKFPGINPDHSDSDYLQWITLTTELELDLGYTPTYQLGEASAVEEPNPSASWLAMQARLAQRCGNQNQANGLYQSAILAEQNEQSRQISPSGLSQAACHCSDISIFEAALDFCDWQHAECIIQRRIENSPNVPYNHLAFARLIILKAEVQQLCTRMDVRIHAPGTEAIAPDRRKALEDSMKQSSNLVQLLEKSHQAYDLSFPITRIERWNARGQIAFVTRPLDPSDAPGLRAAVARLKLSSLAQPQTPEEAAAVITATELLSIQDVEQTSVPQVLQITRPHSRNPLVWFHAALALEANHPQDAFSAVRGATQLFNSKSNPLAALSQALLSRLALQLKDIQTAQESIDIALTVWSDEPAWHLLAAQINQAAAHQSEQVKHLEKAVQLEPGSALYALELGKAYLAENNHDQARLTLAMRALESAARLKPFEVTNWIWLARAQLLAGQMDEAAISVEQVLTLSPENSEAAVLRAEIALQNKSYQAAHDFAQTAVLARPEDPETTLLLAKTLKSLNRPDEALEVLESAIPVSKDPLQLQYERANLLRDLKGPDAALQVLTRLVNDYPEDASILTSLARSQSEMGDQEAAIQTALAALKAGKTSLDSHSLADIHYLTGTLLRRTGQQDQAIMHLNEAVMQAPDMLDAYLELGMARKERREYHQALQAFEQATKLAPHDPRPHYLAGLALKEGKDYKRSEMMLRQAAHLAPDDVIVRRQLAQVVAINVVHNPRA